MATTCLGRCRLRVLPVAVFGVSLGIASQALVWRSLAELVKTTAPSNTSLLGPIRAVVGDGSAVDTAGTVFWYVALATWVTTILCRVGGLVCVPEDRAHLLREWRSPDTRSVHFVVFLAGQVLALSRPRDWTRMGAEKSTDSQEHVALAATFVILIVPQVVMQIWVYRGWLLERDNGFGRSAHPTMQMAVIGNFLGSSAAAHAGLYQCAIFLLSGGLVMYCIVLCGLFAHLSDSPSWNQGAPSHSLFLFIAPPAALSVCCSLVLDDDSKVNLGSIMFLVAMWMYFLVISKTCALLRTPFGWVCWSATFPTAAAATAAITHAQTFARRIATLNSTVRPVWMKPRAEVVGVAEVRMVQGVALVTALAAAITFVAVALRTVVWLATAANTITTARGDDHGKKDGANSPTPPDGPAPEDAAGFRGQHELKLSVAEGSFDAAA